MPSLNKPIIQPDRIITSQARLCPNKDIAVKTYSTIFPYAFEYRLNLFPSGSEISA